MSDSRDIPPGLQRQRRGSMIASLTLIFYYSAGIRIEELATSAATLKIARPEMVPIALWVLWVYFLIRYHQYLQTVEGRWGEKQRFRALTNNELTKMIKALAPEKTALLERWMGVSDVFIRYVPHLKWKLVAVSTPITGQDETSVSVAVGPLALVKAKTLIWYRWLLRDTYFTDYQLPYALALLAFAGSVLALLNRHAV